MKHYLIYRTELDAEFPQYFQTNLEVIRKPSELTVKFSRWEKGKKNWKDTVSSACFSWKTKRKAQKPTKCQVDCNCARYAKNRKIEHLKVNIGSFESDQSLVIAGFFRPIFEGGKTIGNVIFN